MILIIAWKQYCKALGLNCWASSHYWNTATNHIVGLRPDSLDGDCTARLWTRCSKFEFAFLAAIFVSEICLRDRNGVYLFFICIHIYYVYTFLNGDYIMSVFEWICDRAIVVLIRSEISFQTDPEPLSFTRTHKRTKIQHRCLNWRSVKATSWL